MATNDKERTGEATELDHERLDVYRVALAIDARVAGLRRRTVRGHGWLHDQAERASGSMVLNLTEALGRRDADRAQRLRIARGSALETDAAVQLLMHRGVVGPEVRAQVRALVVREVSMLTRLEAKATT
jgi:four helix bundle protein